MITIGIVIACVLGVVGFILYRSEQKRVVVQSPTEKPEPVEPLTVTPIVVTNWQREVDPGAVNKDQRP